MDKRPNIAFSGLTAAGKTTHAKLLAQELGYKYISAAEVFLEIMDVKDKSERAWLIQLDEIETARQNSKTDLEVDARLEHIANSEGGLMLDAIAMGHIYKGPLIRIWLESDVPSRTRKCYVSQGEEKTLDISKCTDFLEEKDGYTRSVFQRLYHFDYFTDMSKYDAILCNTTLIPEATEIASQKGIDTFAPAVSAVVRYLAAAALGAPTQSASEIKEQYKPYILQLNDRPWSF